MIEITPKYEYQRRIMELLDVGDRAFFYRLGWREKITLIDPARMRSTPPVQVAHEIHSMHECAKRAAVNYLKEKR